MTDESIYAAYPRHVGRIVALAAIKRAVIRESKSLGEAGARKMIYEAVCAFAASPQGRRHDRQFIPHCSTWMNQGRYHDDPAEWWAGEAAPLVSRESGIFRPSPDDGVSDGEGNWITRRELEARRVN